MRSQTEYLDSGLLQVFYDRVLQVIAPDSIVVGKGESDSNRNKQNGIKSPSMIVIFFFCVRLLRSFDCVFLRLAVRV